jgi:hypothetical protein
MTRSGNRGRYKAALFYFICPILYKIFHNKMPFLEFGKQVDKKGEIKCTALNTLVYFSGSKQH